MESMNPEVINFRVYFLSSQPKIDGNGIAG
jgi:hypothetical protein